MRLGGRLRRPFYTISRLYDWCKGARWGGPLCLVVLWGLGLGCGSSGGSSSGSSGGGGQAAQLASQSTFATSIAGMTKGDLYRVDLGSGSATLDFSLAPSGATYRLLLQSAQKTSGLANATIASSDLASAASPTDKSAGGASDDGNHDVTATLHEMLRELESSLAVDPVDPAVADLGKSLGEKVSVGDTKTFRVLSSLSSGSSYNSVTATARCVNSEVALYVDTDDTAAFTDAQISTLCNAYATSLAHAYALIGDAPDINGDGVVTVLATGNVNQIGASLGGIVTGFFFGGDLLEQSAGNPAGNEQEIVFVLVPDDGGKYGTAIPTDFAMGNLLTAVVPHEVQHLVSYYQHVIVRSGAAEATWLNEALSHLIEDLVGEGQENPSREALYLEGMAKTALVPSGSPGLAERGASLLFLRFLYEQAANGGAFVNALVNADQTGIGNIEKSFAGTAGDFDEWAELLLRWGVAVALTDAGITSDSRFIYKARRQNAGTGHWEGVCLVCEASDGRGTLLEGPASSTLQAGSASVPAGGMQVYDITTVPRQVSISSGSSDGNLQGVLIRTK